MFDPDDKPEARAKGEALAYILGQLDACDLGAWDRDFVDDMTRKCERHGYHLAAASLTARQEEQLTRMKGQYHVRERSRQEFF